MVLSPSSALIGLPNDTIDPTSRFVDALQAMKDLGLPRLPKLSARERAHETAYAELVEGDLEAAVEAHAAASFDQKLNTPVFETDAAKKLYPGYGAGKAPANDAELEVRATGNHALHPTAAAINELAILKRFDELAQLPTDDPRRAVFVTSGGVAAGKGSLTELVKRLEGDFDFGAVVDAAGEAESLDCAWVLAAAQARGLQVTFGYAENDPMATYESMLARGLLTGRWVDPVTFSRSYSPKNMQEFLSSPAYLAANAKGEAEAIGLFTGAFDVRSLKDATLTPYPQLRMLGNDGVISAADLSSQPRTEAIASNALEQFRKFIDERAAQGKPVNHIIEGVVTNVAKWV